MATFHPFPRLPFELRAMVWALAAEPRTVQIKAEYDQNMEPEDYELHPSLYIEHLFSPTPMPAVLHACRESRKQSPYEKLFYSQETESCYVWVNFDLDMLDVGIGYLDFLFLNKSRVRRLKFQYEEVRDFEWETEDFEDWQFENLVECHVVVTDLRQCARFWGVDFLPSKQENFVFIDEKTGKMMNSCDLDDMVQRLCIITRVYQGDDMI
ncbi:hypothetical protein MAJ_10325, partial [Metarhizium majus ARSEF 297]